ncbi:MAG TPA: HlyD family efflux transporter periplasmic adaptor subunit [Oscillospiraceae bacterium]|nr:HlyD family efflux transporter periplasmic adaptor subunit [Oscillospiraceae bacterium]
MLISALALVVAAGCKDDEEQSAHIKPILDAGEVNYSAVAAELGSMAEKLSVGGSLGYPYTKDLMFGDASGYINELNVKEGQTVAQGDVIAVIDSSNYQYDIDEQMIKIEKARLYIETLKAEEASAYDIENAQLDYEIEQVKYQSMLDTLDAFTLVAPFGGRVESVSELRIGQNVSSRDVICTIADTSKLYAYYIGEDVGKFRYGMDAEVSFEGTIHTGKVISAPDTAPYGASWAASNMIIIDLDETAGLVEHEAEEEKNNNRQQGNRWDNIDWSKITADDIPEGMEIPDDIDVEEFIKSMQKRQEENAQVQEGRVTISIILQKRDDVVIVPDSAVHRFSGKNYVNLLVGKYKIETPVEVGITINKQVEIISGVHEGDKVIIN